MLIADEAFHLTRWFLTPQVFGKISAADGERFAVEAVRLIGHKVAYRPPRAVPDAPYRAHNGRPPRQSPRPDPLRSLRELAAKAIEEFRRAKDSSIANGVVLSIHRAIPAADEYDIERKLNHKQTTPESFAQFLFRKAAQNAGKPA